MTRQILLCLSVAVAMNGQTNRRYTADADFLLGNIVNLNLNNANSLQINPPTGTETFPFINVAASGRGTIVRIQTNSGQVVGEYRTAPLGMATNPSRTTVDLEGNVWSGNRDEGGGGFGSIVKVGLIVGGTRADASGNASLNGEFLKPPFIYNTCRDRNNDGLIRTSRTLGDIQPWPNVTDGIGGQTGLVEDAVDECILIFQRTPGEKTRHVSVDTNNDVWVAGYPFAPRSFVKLKGDTGEVLDTFSAGTFRCGGYGGLVDRNGILWSSSVQEARLLRYNPATRQGVCIEATGIYGLGLDPQGNVWGASYNTNKVFKFNTDGSIAAGFPKSVPPNGPSGMAISPRDGNVWMANRYSATVTRLDPSGNNIKVIPVGRTPTGVAVDSSGKVWVTNYDSHNVMRIDAEAGADGKGAVDLAIPLNVPGLANAYPYNYSDMTGVVAIGSTSPQGTWTITQDSGKPGNVWSMLRWNMEPGASEPAGTSITVEVRSSDTPASFPNYAVIQNGKAVSTSGRYLEVRVTLRASRDGASPILTDLEVYSETRIEDLLTRSKDAAVDVLWSPIKQSKGYNIYRKNGSGPWQRIRSNFQTSVGAFADSGLANGTVYYYNVKWLDTGGTESLDSIEPSAAPTVRTALGARPPTILSVPVVRGILLQPYVYQVRAADPDTGDKLTYRLETAPVGMTINPTTGVISWPPNPQQLGPHKVKVNVQDLGGRFATQGFDVNIAPVRINQAPVFTSTAPAKGITKHPYLYDADATDPNQGDVLAFSLVSGPAGVTVQPGTGLVSWKPLDSQAGSHPVVIQVSDAEGLKTQQSFTLSVVPNTMPSFTGGNPPAAGGTGIRYLHTVTAFDADGGELRFELQSGPTGMFIGPTSGIIEWVPQANQNGSNPVVVRLRDLGGLAVARTWTIQVVEANRAPVFTSTPLPSAAVGVQYQYKANAVDPEGTAVVYSLGNNPYNLTLNQNTGLMTWTPNPEQAGPQLIVIRAKDGNGMVSEQAFTISVGVLDGVRPTISLLSPVNGSVVVADATILGTVQDTDLRSWRVEYRPSGSSEWRTLTSGKNPVTSGSLGILPATLLANDIYRLRLYAEDAGGSVTSPEIEVEVNSKQLKMGDFTLTFEDLRVPAFTFPITINRKYDSKRPQSGDFGKGWTLSFNEVDVRRDVNYNVMVTLPDGRRVKFLYTPISIGLGVFNTNFTAEAGVYDTLENLDCPQVLGGPPNPLCQGFQQWDPQNWRLKTKEGLTFLISGNLITRMEDRSGNWINVAPAGITSNSGRDVVISRDGSNRVTAIRAPGAAAETKYSYDSTGRLIRMTDPSGQNTTFSYEDSRFPHYLTRIVDPLGRPALRNVFNAEGRIVAQCDDNGDIKTLSGCSRFDSQPAARIFVATNARGFRTELLLDERGNVLTERRYTDSTNFLATVRSYDPNNNVLTVRDPAGNVTTSTYDASGNQLTESDPGGRTTRYTYHSCDKVETETDPAGNTTTYTYDAACNLRFVRDALNNATEYRYNAAGQRTHFIDPMGSTWIWSYLSNGLLSALRDPFEKSTTFNFDVKGNLLARTDRMGRLVGFQYDANDQLIRETWSDGRTINYAYGAAGQLTNAVDPDSALTMTYDNLGRLKTVDNLGTPGAPRVVMSYAYDPNGNVTEVGDSLGGITAYSYDPLDRLSTVTQSGTGVQEKRVDMHYDDASLLKEMRRFSNLAGTLAVANSRYEYDCGGCAGRLTAIRHRKASDDSVIHDLTFTRDPLGNIRQMTDAEGTHNYTYDDIRRLRTATHSNPALQPNEFYTYDGAGNRLTSHLSHFYSYSYQTEGKGNRLLQDNQFDYAYDDEGNQIRRTDRATGAYTEYSYDFRNRMNSAVQKTRVGAETLRSTSSFDALNRRIRSLEGGQPKWFILDGLNPVLKIDHTGTKPTRRMYGPELDASLADEDSVQTRWFVMDQIGSARDLISPSGLLFNHYTYDSFGRMLSQSSPATENDIRFASREFDSQDGLGFFRARFYDPSRGQFQQEDLYEPFLYHYADSNPLLFTDPLGEATLGESLNVLRSAALRTATAARNMSSCLLAPALLTIIALNPGAGPEAKLIQQTARAIAQFEQRRRKGVCKLADKVESAITRPK